MVVAARQIVRNIPALHMELDIVKPLICTLAVHIESVFLYLEPFKTFTFWDVYTNAECLVQCRFFYILGIPRISLIYLAQEGQHSKELLSLKPCMAASVNLHWQGRENKSIWVL